MEIGELVVRLTANSAGLTAGLSKASGSVAAFGKRMQSVGSSMTRFVTLPVLAVGGAAIHAALDFEKAMTNIRALVGESAKTVAAYRQEIMKLAPALGKSPQELGEALYFITSSGFKGAAALRVLTASAKASAAGLGETQIIAQAVGAAVNAYGEKSLSAAKATDILLAAVREGTGEAADYATAIGRVIPIAQVMGVSFGEVAGTMAALSLNGTSAHEAVVQITAGLAQAIKPTKQGTDALKSLGMSYGDLRREIKDKGLAQVFEDLKEKFHGNVEEIGKVFGNIRALRGVLTLSGVSAEKYGGIIDRVTKSQGDVNKAFAITSETAGFKLHKALAKLQVVGIQIGDKLVPALVRVAEWVGRLADRFSALSPHTQDFIIKVTLLTAALGPLLSVGGKLLTIGSKLIKVLAAIRAAFVFTSAAAVTATTSVAAASVAVQATTRAFGYTVPILGQTAVATERVAASTAVATRRFALLSGGLGAVAIRLGVVAAAGYGVYKAIEDITTTGGWKQFTDFLKNPFSDQGKKDFDALLARVEKLKELEKSLTLKPKLTITDVKAKLKKMSDLVHIFGAKIPKDFMASLAGLPGSVSKVAAAAANKFMLAWAKHPAWAKKIGLAIAAELALGIAQGSPEAWNAATQLMAGITNRMFWHGRTPGQGLPTDQTDQAGGVYSSPRVTLVGEAGPEAIIPLSRPRRAAEVMQQAGIGGPTFKDCTFIGSPPERWADMIMATFSQKQGRIARGYT